MASTIAAITTGTGGVVTTADASGNLSLLSGATTVVAVTSTGATVTGTLAATGAVTASTTLAVTGASTFTGTGKFATTIGVGNATPAASGSGITFPATQSASSDANTLDDYEEGTWSPQVYYQNAANQSAAVNTTQTGTYTKIGNVVTLQWYLVFTAPVSPAVDNIGIKNMPFTLVTPTTCPFYMSGSASLVANGGYIYYIYENNTIANILSCTGVGNLGSAIGGGSRTFIGGCTFKII